MCGILGLLSGYAKKGWRMVILGIVAGVIGSVLGLLAAFNAVKVL